MSLPRSLSEPSVALGSRPASEIDSLCSPWRRFARTSDATMNGNESDSASMFLCRRSTPGPSPQLRLVARTVVQTDLLRAATGQGTIRRCSTRRSRSSSSLAEMISRLEPPQLAPPSRSSNPTQMATSSLPDQEAILGGEMTTSSPQEPVEAAQAAPLQATRDDTSRPPAPDSSDGVPRTTLWTVPGICMVCLTECEDTLGSDWLHQEMFASIIGNNDKTPCAVSACLSCLKTYFEGIVARGFEGSCPRMRCMCCPRVVCERAWLPLVDPSVIETFRQRAETLLTLQCASCHERDSVMVGPLPDRACRSTLVASMTAVVSSVRQLHGKVGGDCHSLRVSEGGTIHSTSAQAFRVALARYASGQDVDVAKVYNEVETLFFAGLDRDEDYDVRYPRMVDVLRCVEDSERRAGLHLRYFRFHPMVKTKCCQYKHCFRCRIRDGHPGLTCEQFEASRGYAVVRQCPECGISIVKGDGCESVACVCGASLDWSFEIEERNRQALSVLRLAYPEDTERAVVTIIRGGPPLANRNPGLEEVDPVPAVANEEIREETGQPRVDPDRRQNGDDGISFGVFDDVPGGQNVPEPVLEPAPERSILSPGSDEEFRLACLFEEVFPVRVTVARARVFAEEHPQLTFLHATSLTRVPRSGTMGPQPLDYFGRRNTNTTVETAIIADAEVDSVELQWQRDSGRSWLVLHEESEIRRFRQRATAARSSLVEALYGDDDNDSDSDANSSNGTINAIAYFAADHSRAALRNAWAEHPEQALFSWLGIPDCAGGKTEDLQILRATAGGGEWEAPFGQSEIEGEEVRPLPPPEVLWGCRPPREFALSRPSVTFRPNPVTRSVSAVSCFGSMTLSTEVVEWLSASSSRQRRLRQLMGREEDRLSKAWIALWGRGPAEGLFGSLSPHGQPISDRHDQQRAVAVAARRCAFLDAYPEHACREHLPMMTAFVRRNYAVVERVRADAIAQRAARWEAALSVSKVEEGDTNGRESEKAGGRGNEGVSTSSSSSSVSFRRAYAVYLSHVKGASAAGYVPGKPKYSPPKQNNKTCGKAVGFKRENCDNDCLKKGVTFDLQKRTFDRLMTAWGWHNRLRIAAQRFADAHGALRTGVLALEGEAGGGQVSAAALVAVTVLKLVPMLMGKASSMCRCDINFVKRDAEVWRTLNGEEYNMAFEGINVRVEAGVRVLEGCECQDEACSSRLVACPVVVRRLLRVPSPKCPLPQCGDLDPANLLQMY